jgi:hypothetical protein
MNDNDDFRFDTPDTSHLAPIWRPLPAKLRAYEAVYLLNRSFHDTLLNLERMERLGIFGVHYLNETKIRLEVLRCDLGEDLALALQELEENDTGRFAKMQRYLDRQHRDPDDVFLQAEERRQEIRDQIKELQRGLGKDAAKPKVLRKKRKSAVRTEKSN